MLALFKKLKPFYSIFKEAPIDAKAFKKNYKRCDIMSCQGMCCNKGGPIGEEEEELLRKLLKKHKGFFEKVANLPEDPLDVYTMLGQRTVQTKTRPVKYRSDLNVPENFSPAACVFLDDEYRCTLQLLSVHLGKHPWYYKPSGCWMHPVQVGRDAQPAITIFAKEDYDPDVNDVEAFFAPFTKCGESCGDGVPGYQLFKEELAVLSQAIGRDLVKEVEDACFDKGSVASDVQEE